MNRAFLDFRSCFAPWIKWEWRRWKTNRQKRPENIQFYSFMRSPIWSHPIYLHYQPPEKLTSNPCSCGPANICLMLTTLLHASVKAQETPGPLPQYLPSHTLLLPSLTWIIHPQTVCMELMSQLLREPQRHPDCCTKPPPLLALYSPPDVHGAEWWIMGRHSSALFCRVTTLEGDCMWLSAAGPIFKHIHGYCDVMWPTAGCTRACSWAYMCERPYAGTFNWYFYACMCKQIASWIINRGKSCVSLQFPHLCWSWTLLGSR